jgi:tape measure domain-containing protein
VTAEEINAARRSLTQFRGEFQRFTGWAGNAGRASGKNFGKNFKSVAVFAITEFSRGALQAVGARIVNNWGATGTKTGRSFGKNAKKAAQAEMQTFSAKVGGGARWNLGALPIVGAAALAALAAGQVKNAFESAIEQERITISLDALSLDGGGGSRIFDALRADALRTGIDVSSQAGVVQKMMAQGIDEAGALKLNRAMLDIAGGTGLTTAEVELLGTALSQVKGKGVAAMEELRGQIAEKGVPIFEALRQRFNAETVAEVFKAIAAGKVTADDVLETFSNLEGPFARFIGASDRLGQTGGGLIGRLKQEATDLQRVFAAEVMPELKPALEFAIGLIQRMKDGAAEFGKELANAIGFAQAAFESLTLTEMLQLAGLALKEKLLEAFDVAQRGASALFAAMQDDTFGTMLERAALRFKEIMLSAAAEIADSLAAGAGGKTKVALENAANFARGSADVAAAQREDIEAREAGSVGDFLTRLRREFETASSQFALSEADRASMNRLLERITARREETLAGRTPDEPVVAPGGVAAGGASSGPFDPTGMIAGGIANAISRITGGGDILLTKQLSTQEGTRKAAEETAANAERTAVAVEKLVTQTNPRRARSQTATLTL